jgi:tetratricopeptide (TPR) repeat protein
MKRVLLWLTLIVTLAPCSVGAGEATLPKASQDWIDLRTANFRFFSNAGRRTTRRVAVDLEELRAVLAELTHYDLQSPVPTLIYVFKSERSFRPFKNLYRDRPASVSGYFIPGETASYIALDASSNDASAIIYHEYVHYVANNNLWYLPLWFSEGLAEFYESFNVDGDTVYLGLPVLRHMVVLHRRSLIPLDQLFSVDRESDMYNEADRKGIFYAESWALVHYFLLGNDDRRHQLSNYLGMVRHGVDEETAFAKAFSTDYESLASELRGYLRSFRLPWIEAKTSVDLEAEFEIRKMSYAEVLYRLGDLLAAQQPQRPERLTFFEKSTAIDPAYGAPVSALAVEAEERADWEAARQLHERAADLSLDDPLVLYRWGEFMRHRGGDFQKTAAILTRSTELDPSFAPAWAALAAVYADAGDTSEEAVEAARTAYSMRPSDVGAARNLVRLYLRLDRRSEAVSLIEESLGSHPRLQAEAWTLVVQRDLLRVRDLLRDDQLEEATRTLARAEELADRSLHPDALRSEIEWARRSVAEQHAAGLYRQAQESYANNDSSAARESLERALEVIDDGPVAFSCRQLLDILDHPERSAGPRKAAVELSPTPEDIAHLSQLIASKDYEGAIEFLEGMRDGAAPLHREWFDDRIQEIQRVIDHGNFVDEYNRAVDLYNQKHFGEAVKILRRLLETLPEGSDSEDARVLLDDALAMLDAG